ncbi:MipA/OmpV family protein [Oceanospirillum beijerinckii]|uniref:MipA/OmpV family protein n=1 Tax=Oceanospirillum beijerinckii TaxID=64976 RepID=UPI00040038A2|nr:MipA/OmpV family protein [Oceanospirillum beijerinckii]
MLTQKMTTPISTGFLLTALLSGTALANDAIGPGDSDSKWVLGGHVGVMSNPYAGENEDGFLMPNVEYRGERFFIKDGEMGYSLYQGEHFSAGAVLTGQGSFLSDKDDYQDNAKLAGLKERDGTLDLGFYVIKDTDMGRVRFTFLEEVTGEHKGRSADLKYTFAYQANKLNVNPFVGVNWTSADKVDHFFGVSSAEATADRAAYKGDGSLNVYTGVRGRYEITKNWDVSATAAYVHLGDGIRDSSIVDEDHVLVGTVGVNYNF